MTRTSSQKPSSYLLDSQNSTRDVIDNAGGVLDSIQFDAWGNITAETDDAHRGRYA